MLGCMTGPAMGAPIAMGALSIAGVDMTVPHGEPLWKKFLHRPQQPLLVAASAATPSKIVSFLMVRFSAASAPPLWGVALNARGGGMGRPASGGAGRGASNSTPRPMMCKRNA
jgi:hypothetical protein